jgi:hypothetical protein
MSFAFCIKDTKEHLETKEHVENSSTFLREYKTLNVLCKFSVQPKRGVN